MSAAEGFRRYAAGCSSRVPVPLERRPGNALNIEIGQPADRCRLLTPDHWPSSMGAGRWLASGGSALVLGHCSAGGCPLKPNHCACGHRALSHDISRGGCMVPDCTCERTPEADAGSP